MAIENTERFEVTTPDQEIYFDSIDQSGQKGSIIRNKRKVTLKFSPFDWVEKKFVLLDGYTLHQDGQWGISIRKQWSPSSELANEVTIPGSYTPMSLEDYLQETAKYQWKDVADRLSLELSLLRDSVFRSTDDLLSGAY